MFDLLTEYLHTDGPFALDVLCCPECGVQVEQLDALCDVCNEWYETASAPLLAAGLGY